MGRMARTMIGVEIMVEENAWPNSSRKAMLMDGIGGPVFVCVLSAQCKW